MVPLNYVTIFVNGVYNKYRARHSCPAAGITMSKAIEVTMRMKCLLAITAALILLGLIATLAYTVIGTVS
jgi:hypothetical protein